MSERDIVELLRRHAIRPTALRVALCRLFVNGPAVLSAPQALARLRQQQRVHKVTVYRNLELFQKQGLLRPLHLGGRSCYYELVNRLSQSHPHFQCQVCGEVQCLPPVDPQKFWQLLAGPAGNLAQRLDIFVTGLCRRCRLAGN